METKDLIGLALILLAIPASVLVCCVWQRGRDAAFFLMAAGVVLTEKLDINFVTRYWYRGTTRGFEFTFIDILALGVLVSSFMLPRPGLPRVLGGSRCLAGPGLVAAAASNLPNRLRWFSALAIAAAGVTIVLTISRAGIPIFALVTLGATAFCISWRITLKKIAVTALI